MDRFGVEGKPFCQVAPAVSDQVVECFPHQSICEGVLLGFALELQHQALAQIACGNSRWIELLENSQQLFRFLY